jgi:ABC-2 type transport system permease protein
MNTAVVVRGLQDRRRSVLGYGIGLGLMIVWVMALYPSVERELADYVDAMPEAMKSLFAIDDITSLAGFVHAEIFSLIGPLVFVALAMTSGAAAIAGEERERILPVVLATGVGRRNLLLARLAALALQLAGLGAITFAALLVGLLPASGGIGVPAAAGAVLQLTALGILFGTLALTIGAATGRKGLAVGTATGTALAAYLIDALANVVGWLEPFEEISPFHWYAPANPLTAGPSLGGFALLVGASAVLAVIAVLGFDRRDVGVGV